MKIEIKKNKYYLRFKPKFSLGAGSTSFTQTDFAQHVSLTKNKNLI
jgi:hypothetical protein